MKRLGIFCFYGREGIVDSYIEYLLSELMTVLDKLLVVVNGYVNEKGKHVFSRYTNDLIIRENKGFDGGAYSDVIVNVLGDNIRDWDKLILCNDTFFGPFVPMKSIFEKMEREQLDFWGLNMAERKMMSQIQSYFLVFGAKILKSGELTRYFHANIDPLTDDIVEIYGKFEHGLFFYLTGKQYSYGAYCNTELCSYYESPDVCLERYGLPILKKKAFLEKYNNAQAAINAVRYVRHSSNYDIDHISHCVWRLYGLRLGRETLSEYGAVDKVGFLKSCLLQSSESYCNFEKSIINTLKKSTQFPKTGLCQRLRFVQRLFFCLTIPMKKPVSLAGCPSISGMASTPSCPWNAQIRELPTPSPIQRLRRFTISSRHFPVSTPPRFTAS